MALPFLLPSDEEVEENYRRLERLLRDLYQVLHVLLGGGAPVAHPRHPHNQPPPPPPPPSSGTSMTVPRVHTSAMRAAFPTLFTPQSPTHLLRGTPTLPDAMFRLPIQKTSNNTAAPAPSQVKTAPLSSSSPAYWKKLGSELREIADGFKASRRISLQVEMERSISISGSSQSRSS